LSYCIHTADPATSMSLTECRSQIAQKSPAGFEGRAVGRCSDRDSRCGGRRVVGGFLGRPPRLIGAVVCRVWVVKEQKGWGFGGCLYPHPGLLRHNVSFPEKGGAVSLVAERSTRAGEPRRGTPPSAHPLRVGVSSLICAALCGWVLVPLLVSAGLVVSAMTMLAGAVALVVFLMAVGSRLE
jgi:hypothetical protein